LVCRRSRASSSGEVEPLPEPDDQADAADEKSRRVWPICCAVSSPWQPPIESKPALRDLPGALEVTSQDADRAPDRAPDERDAGSTGPQACAGTAASDADTLSLTVAPRHALFPHQFSPRIRQPTERTTILNGDDN